MSTKSLHGFMQSDFYSLDLLFLFYYYHHYFSIDCTGKLQEICEKCTLVNFKFGQTCSKAYVFYMRMTKWEYHTNVDIGGESYRGRTNA